MSDILEFGKRRAGKSLLPQDQIIKRNEFDDAARHLACIVRRATIERNLIKENILLCFESQVEASEFLRLMAKVQRRRTPRIKRPARC